MPLLAPRYWPTWLGLGFLWCVTRLPYAVQMWTGAGIGRLAYLFARQRRRIAATNLKLCFPDMSERQRDRLLRRNFVSLGRGIVETALCWWGRDSQLRRLLHITGIEHLQQALAGKRGVILLSAHFTTLEIGGRLLSLEAPFQVLYRTHKNTLFETVMRHSRERRFETAIPRNDTRTLIASLRAGKAVWYAPDQNHGGTHSIFVPFFGVPAATITSTSRIAAISGARVVPFFQTRLPNKRGYLLTLCPALDNFPGDDIRADTERINQVFEAVIREMPEQYLWVHRRFKSRPDGEVAPYEG